MEINEGMRMAWYVWRTANSQVWMEGMQRESPGEGKQKKPDHEGPCMHCY